MSEDKIDHGGNPHEIEHFVHVHGARPRAVKAPPTDTLEDVLTRLGIRKEGNDEILVFIGECDEALADNQEGEAGADHHAPIDAGLTLEALELHRHRHVHCHTCRHIAVHVNFNGESRHRKFSPATTIAVVTHWAWKKFGLDAAAAADYVLQIAGSEEQPRPDQHLGELTTGATCALAFDLVKELTPQG